MKRAAGACILGLLVPLLIDIAIAEPWIPTRPVKIIVPFPGGGTNDVLARIIAERLQAKWNQPVVIENKTGAGGNIGAASAYQSDPDGYTLLLSPPGPLAINQSLYKQLAYRPQEFVPLTVVGAVPNAVIVRNELAVSSFQALIDYIKARPGKISFGSQGNGATPHLTAVMFQNMTGTQMVHVPYRGENLVLNDMIGGHVDVFFGNVAASLAPFRDGRVKILAVADRRRSALLPEVPTTAEVGLPSLLASGWFALVAPPNTERTLASDLAADAIEVIKLPDVQMRIRAANVEPVGNSSAETTAFIAEEAQRWGEVIRKNNIVVD